MLNPQQLLSLSDPVRSLLLEMPCRNFWSRSQQCHMPYWQHIQLCTSQLLSYALAIQIHVQTDDISDSFKFINMRKLGLRPTRGHTLRSRVHNSVVEIDRQLINNNQASSERSCGQSHSKSRDEQLQRLYLFNKKQRSNFLKNVIHNYMESQDNPETPSAKIVNSKVCIRRSSASSQNRYRSTKSISTNMSFASPLSNLPYVQSLPIIEESQNNQLNPRPKSQGYCMFPDLDISPLMHKEKSLLSTKKTIGLNNQNVISLSSQRKSNKSFRSSRFSTPSETGSLQSCKYFSYREVVEPINSQTFIAKQFTNDGKLQLQKQLRTQKLGAKVMWKKSDFDDSTLIFNCGTSLSNQLFYRRKIMNGGELIYQVYPKQAYNRLFVNKNEELVDIICCVASQIAKLNGKIMVNGVFMSNIYRLGEKQIYIRDWTFAAIREEVVTTTATFHQDTDPLLKLQERWICKYQYLAPEIISWAREGFKDKSIWDDCVLSDVWSLGCMLLEILTLIPLGSKQRHTVKGRPYFRKGLLAMQNYSDQQFSRRQKLFVQNYLRQTKKQVQGMDIEQKIWVALEGMLKFKRESRMSPEEVVRLLSH